MSTKCRGCGYKLQSGIGFNGFIGDTCFRCALAEYAGLRAIVDKLPRTADGVPVVPTVDCVYVWVDEVILRCRQPDLNLGKPTKDCYSTREAAQAALDAEAKPKGGE